MKLFVVNRYGAEDESVNKDDNVQKKRLDDLLIKAQKRKEKALHDASADAQGVPAKKKKLKATLKDKVATEPSVNNEIGTLEDASVEPSSVDGTNNEATTKAKEDGAQQPDGFTVIGKDQFKKIKEAKGVLPKWLAQPTLIAVDMKNLDCDIDNFSGLSPQLIKNLKENSVENVFPVQREVIPWLLKEYRNSLTGYWPRDLCVSAPTGSGKTLAFALPLIQLFIDQPILEIKALVVLPVQDLAKQVFQVFQTYCKNTNVKVALATGQGQLEEEQQKIIKKDKAGNFRTLVHIMVTTPGRLVHHLRDTDGLDLSKLRFLVVDEADRVMDSAQSDWLFHLEKHIAKNRLDGTSKRVLGQVPPLSVSTLKTQIPPPQKLLFSATLSQDPEKLARLALFQPKLFTCIVKTKNQTAAEQNPESDSTGHFSMPAEIKENYVLCEDEGAKPLLLHCLLTKKAEKLNKKKGRICKTLCFASTKLAAHRLCLILKSFSESLDKKLTVAEISADLRLSERNAILEKFTTGDIDVIVSSDALARGIDIPTVDCVISYDVPLQAKLYVHRVGRTGRAGRKGEAITVLSPLQLPSFQHLLRGAGKESELKAMKSPDDEMEALEEKYKAALTSVKKTIQDERKRVIVIKKKKIGVLKKRQTRKERPQRGGRGKRYAKKTKSG